MRLELVKVQLANVCDGISYGYTESANSDPVGPKFLRITDIQDGKVDWSCVPYCKIEDKKIKQYQLSWGDIVVARTGNSTGENYAFKGAETTVFASYLIRFKVNKSKANPFFVWYQMRTKRWWDFIASSKSGSAQAGANAQVLGRFAILLPSLDYQGKVVSQLEILDKKTELNHQTNQTLEKVVQTIFKSWFIDFDPVRAKMAAKAEGRDPIRAAMCTISGKTEIQLEAMPQDQYQQLSATAALFPEEMEESELGEVPKGWRYSTVENDFILTMGQSPPGDTYNELGEGLPFYQGRTDFGFRFPAQRIFCKEPTRIAEVGDTLVSVRAPVGDVNMAIEKCCIGRGVASIRHPKGYRGFTFYMMHGLRERFSAFDAEGTVFGSINKKDFQSLPVISPSYEILAAYEFFSEKFDTMIVNNEEQVRTLTTLRDTLLPKLLSGELTLPPEMLTPEEGG